MNTRVSVQIVAKETTPLGRLFFSCCLQALLDSRWPNEIVVVDNGCSADVLEMLEGFQLKFAGKDVTVKVLQMPQNSTYAELRNAGMTMIDPQTTIYHWIDTDEVYIPYKLDQMREFLEDMDQPLKQMYTYFYHFMFNPWTWQFKATKNNVFAYHPGLHWTKGVHEQVDNLLPGRVIQTDVEYLHFGYLRPQWQTCLKWLHYDMIEHGHVNRYKDEPLEDQHKQVYTLPYFREWRTPNTIVDDRLDECKKNIPWPKHKVPSAAMPIYTQADRWQDFLLEIEDQTFWHAWQAMAETAGSWRDTLDEVVQRMDACNWSYDGKKKENS